MNPSYVRGAPLPASIGLCADLYNEVRELRLEMQKVVDEVKARETEIREHIIETLSASDDTGAAGKRYRAQIVTKIVPTVQDWASLHEFIRKNKRFDLLQKRISDTAVKGMWEEGAEVPGVGRLHNKDVSITKI